MQGLQLRQRYVISKQRSIQRLQLIVYQTQSVEFVQIPENIFWQAFQVVFMQQKCFKLACGLK